MPQLTVKQRVANGVKLLNKEVPNWRKKINLKTFDANDPQKCVLAQVFGDYYNGVNFLGLPPSDSYDPEKSHGFWPENAQTDPNDAKNLNKEWKRVIAQPKKSKTKA